MEPRASKEKSSTATITVIEGVVTAKHIGNELKNVVDRNGWKWSATKIAEKKFPMRFPDARMVPVYSYFKSLVLKAVNAQIVVEPWSSSIGWFRVRGIPVD